MPSANPKLYDVGVTDGAFHPDAGVDNGAVG